MSGTFPALELKPDGDVSFVKVNCSSQKPTLKDIQKFLKKKSPPAVITSYPYGTKRITMLGYVKGKETELSQHELPAPCAITEIYGSILLIAHTTKTTWDQGVSHIEQFQPTDYEVFYEKACSGELEEDADEDDKEEGDDAKDAEDEDVDVDAEDDALEEGAEDIEEELVDEEEEEEAPRVRVSRKVPKIDPQQLQFQFKSVLEPEPETVQPTVKYRLNVISVFSKVLKDHCDEDDILDLERGIYNASLDDAKKRMVPLTWDHEVFRWTYSTISKRTLTNLFPNSYVGNKTLIERWKEGEFTLDAIGRWTPYELNPANWKDLKDQQFRRDKRILEGNLAMATDRFRCSQCKKKLCSYYELQTRSADEPMTIFISCLNCGKHWKQ
jgi:hypothetical protein